MEGESLAARMAAAFKRLGFFLFDRELDPIEEVFALLRGAGVEHIVEVHSVARNSTIYIVEIKESGCRRTCSYERGCGKDKTCLERCIEGCLSELRRKVAEALRGNDRRNRGGSVP